MNFIPKQHLEIGNYIKYIDEILHKCDKGIEYCKICPNEFVCAELEKDDFGLTGLTVSDILTAIQYALNKIPGFLNPDKRENLRIHIKNYIAESPIHERDIWENSILNILLDKKLANQFYKPEAKIGKIRTLLTYNAKISFSIYLTCLYPNNNDIVPETLKTLHCGFIPNNIMMVNQFAQKRHTDIIIPPTINHIKYCLEKEMNEILEKCDRNDIGLATALCYYAVLTKSLIPENIAVTGGLDSQGRVLPGESLDSKIETVLRELHFIDKVIIPRGSLLSISIPSNIRIIEVSDIEQAIDSVFKNTS